LRTTVRLRKTLVDQRTAWQQRIHAALFHHGLPRPEQELLSRATRGWLERVALPPASRQLLGVALRQIDHLDARRFVGGDQVVRATGLDITVCASDGKRSPGHLSRQGPQVLRWALFAAAKAAARPSSPDYAYYQQVKARQGGNRATLAVARKLVRRVRHTLLQLGDAALAPVDGLPLILSEAA
jgi:transposase